MKPNGNRARVVIIGGGFGGLQAARDLKRAPVALTLIDRSNHHLFQPLLYQVATAGLSPADIAMPIRSVLRHQSNAEVILDEVIGVDDAHRRVQTESGLLIPYDFLIIATGATHSYLGHEEWKSIAPGLKTIADATSIRRKILLAFERAEMEQEAETRKAWLSFLLVGGGPTGVEMAGSIAELAKQALREDFRKIDPASARITLIEAGPRLLSAFSEKLALKAQAELNRLGVEVLTGFRVRSIDQSGVEGPSGRISAKTVLWCAGVRASQAGSWLNAERDPSGRVFVDAELRVPGREGVFVIGDTAHFTQEGRMLPGVAPVALQQGAYVARWIEGRVRGRPASAHFKYRDKGNLATVGRTYAIAEIGKIRVSGRSAWTIWLFVHIYYLIGFKNRALVLLQWMWAYLTFQRGARLIVNEESSLRE